jgi:UDP-sulfoquinovose synthase
MGSWSATPIQPISERLQALEEHYGVAAPFWEGDLVDYELVAGIFDEFQPEAIVHLGECPSAPYSMIDAEHALFVQRNNLTSTTNFLFAMHDYAPDAHLVKLGTMGEYGTPNVDIPEGFFEIEYRGRRDRLPFPRQAGSWYHWSKVHGSNNIMFACRLWGLRATDIMQGVVFGTSIDDVPTDDRLLTRLDFDQAFGTAVNRFCCQAVVGHPLTPFGIGHQRRGFLPLRDSMQCLSLIIENPPDPGEYRVFNQFQEVYDIAELALKVSDVATDLGMDAEVRNIENPRLELEEHYYEPDHQKLFDLGYQPSKVEDELRAMLEHLTRYRHRIEPRRDVLVPDVRWDGRREKARFLDTVAGAEVTAGDGRFQRAPAPPKAMPSA